MHRKPNKYGLVRKIPEAVAREVRQNSGFGCVICGLCMWQYDHVDPEFKDCKKHESCGITLLCWQCHGKKTNGFIDKETVLNAMKNPKAKQKGFSNEFFISGRQTPIIFLGGAKFENVSVPLMVNKEPVFSVVDPEEKEGPFQFSASFYNSRSIRTLKIENNEWKASDDNWDVNVQGSTMTVREKLGKICLQIKVIAPNGIKIERLDMVIDGEVLKCKDDLLSVNGITFKNVSFLNMPVALIVKNGVVSLFR